MRVLLVASLALALLGQEWHPSQKTQASPHDGKIQSYAQNVEQAKEPSSVVPNASDGHNPRLVNQASQGNTAPKQNDTHKGAIERRGLWQVIADIIIAAATVAYFLVSIFTLLAIRHQAKIAEIAANAAKASAYAARQSIESSRALERAWVAVKVSNPPYTTRPPRILTETTPVRIVYSPYNRGNSLAWITSIWIKACAFTTEGGMPEQPDYWTEPCSVSLRDCEIVVEPGREIPSPAYVQSGTFSGVYSKERFLHIYGMLTYRDAWDQPHETRFCYCYYVSQGANDVLAEAFYPVGPKAYNKQT